MRTLLLAETDAYFKYGSALRAVLGTHGIASDLAIIDGPLAPTPEQIEQVITDGNPPERFGARRIVREILDGGHDWTFLLATGPVIAYLSAEVRRRGSTARLATLTPGVALPERSRAMRARQFTDLFVVHSALERLAFERLISEMGLPTTVALTTLPLISELGEVPLNPSVDCIFAAQPSVPSLFVERTQLLMALGTTYQRVGVKLRTVGGEGAQTHHEPFSYGDIASQLNDLGAGTFITIEGSMRNALEMSDTLVTVSSTAALEAIAAGRKVRIIDDFGVSPQLINHVFTGSDLIGPAAEPPTRPPNPVWLEMNYFHDTSHNDLEAALERITPHRWSLRPAASRSFAKAVAQGYRKLSEVPGIRRH